MWCSILESQLLKGRSLVVLSSADISLGDSSVEIDIVTGFVRVMVASTLALTLLTSASTSLRKFVRLAAAPFFALTRLQHQASLLINTCGILSASSKGLTRSLEVPCEHSCRFHYKSTPLSCASFHYHG